MLRRLFVWSSLAMSLAISGAIMGAMSSACRVASESRQGDPRSVAPMPSGVLRSDDAGVIAVAPAPLERAVRPPLDVSEVKDCEPPGFPSPSAVRGDYDVVYSSPGGRPQRLDVVTPSSKASKASNGPYPLVVMIHGGAWIGGDRLYHRDDLLKLAGQGYVAATIDYRLAGLPKNAFPADLSDARCAVRFLRAHAAQYDIDPTRVAAIGDSAGGHIAAMLAVASDVPDDGTCAITSESSSLTSAVIDYAPLDLRASKRYPPSIQQAVRYLVGGDPLENAEKTSLASPITHVDAGDPPMLIIHGAADHVVPVEDSREFAAALASAHVPSLYVELAGMQHGFLVLGSGGILRRSTCTTMAFLARTLK